MSPLQDLRNLREDPTIEALRGLAALLVVVTHYSHFLTDTPGLWAFASTGVDLFFVLSGYVFAPYLMGKPLQWLPHLVRRFFRLYPLYVAALLLYALLRLPASDAFTYLPHHLLMLHTTESLEIANYYNPAFWSLPPEVEFYLALPLLAIAMAGFKQKWLGIAILCVGAFAMRLALVAMAQAGEGVTARAIATVHLPGLLIEFIFGFLAFVAAQRGDRAHALLRFVLGLGVLAATAYTTTASRSLWITGLTGMGAAAGYALLVSAMARPSQPYTGRWTPLFLWAGHLSYGTYLLHNAAPQMLARVAPTVSGAHALLACVLITLLMATMAHWAIERPLRQWGRRRAQALTK